MKFTSKPYLHEKFTKKIKRPTLYIVFPVIVIVILASFSRSLKHFFLTVGQNNFGNKIPFVVSCLPNDKESVETTTQWRQKQLYSTHISNPLNLLFVCFCWLPVLNLGQVSGNIRDVFQFATLELPDNLSSRKDISQLGELFSNGGFFTFILLSGIRRHLLK